VLDYRTFLRELDRYPDVPLMLEHLPDADCARARDHIFSVGDEIGVGFVGRLSCRRHAKVGPGRRV